VFLPRRPVATPLGVELLLEAERAEAVHPAVRNKYDAPAPAAVASIRAASRHELLAVKTD
jgi:hypothetical protein